MYLVDTCVWIGYLKESEAVARFLDVLDLGLPFGITGVVYGEVLQGVRTPNDFEQLKEYLSTQRFYHLRDPIVGYEEAARLYYRCRRVAIEHDVTLLHDDSDFVNMGCIVTELKLT